MLQVEMIYSKFKLTGLGWKCMNCLKHLPDALEQLENHLLECPWQCRMCQAELSSMDDVYIHLGASNHKGQAVGQYYSSWNEKDEKKGRQLDEERKIALLQMTCPE